MDHFSLLRPEGFGLDHPGYQITQVVAASFETSCQLFKHLLISKFKRMSKSVCPYFHTWTPAKAIFFPSRQGTPWSRAKGPPGFLETTCNSTKPL